MLIHFFFSNIDMSSDQQSFTKADTIGDAYILFFEVSEQNSESLQSIVSFGNDIIKHFSDFLKNFKIETDPSYPLFLRCGVAYGTVFNAIVGVYPPSVQYFGIPLSQSQHSESCAAPNSIHFDDSILFSDSVTL